MDAALDFPAVIFTFALAVVVLYWIVALVGGLGIDLLDTDTDGGADTDGAGWLSGLGLGGVPATITLSLFVCGAWLASIVGAVLIGDQLSGGWLAAALGAVLLAALVVGWVLARLLITPLRGVFTAPPAPSRADFVGRACVVRTSSVGPDFGQAEVTSEDGSSALVQVRQSAEHATQTPMPAGTAAVIYDYDAEGEFFWVSPIDDGFANFNR